MAGQLKVNGVTLATENASVITLENPQIKDSSNNLILDQSGSKSVLKNVEVVNDSPLMFRNLLYNGAMQISQRGDVTGVSSTTYGGPDRFQHIMGSAGTFSISQSTDAPDGFSNSIKVACTSSTSLSTGNIYQLGQKIEGQNVQHLEYGSSTAKSLTFSFWVKTNVSGDYAVEFFSQTANRQISKSFNISSAEASAFSWVKRTMTIPGDTVTAVPNNNTAELAFYIWLCAGTDYTSGTLNSSAWVSNTNANRALAINLGSSTSNEFYLTGVQLEIGNQATPFEHRPIGMELGLCQRYYYRLPDNLNFSNRTTSTNIGDPCSMQALTHPTTMRAAPTLTIATEQHIGGSGWNQQITDKFWRRGRYQSGGGTTDTTIKFTAPIELNAEL